MITNYETLKKFIIKDKMATEEKYGTNLTFYAYIKDDISRYLLMLRIRELCQYRLNNDTAGIKKLALRLLNHFLRKRIIKLGIKLGFDISINSVGPGIRIDHYGFLAINEKASVGMNCHIYGDVTIGIQNSKDKKGPKLGDNVTIGAGARILGPIRVASNTIIGANAVVIKDVDIEGSIVAGVPAKVIEKNMEK